MDLPDLKRSGSTLILSVLALFYLYGAIVHVANMAGLTGIDWPQAPRKWQVLDVAYLVLDVAVVWALVRRPTIGVPLLWLAALSQILLYTVFRDWVLDVPPDFAPTNEERGYLDTLVLFHVVSSLAAGAALWLRR